MLPSLEVSQTIFKRMQKGLFFLFFFFQTLQHLCCSPTPQTAAHAQPVQRWGEAASSAFPRSDTHSWKQAFGELLFVALPFPQQQRRYFLPTPPLTLCFKEQLLFRRCITLHQITCYSAVNYLKIESSPARCLSWSCSPNPTTETKGWERRVRVTG